MDDVWIDAVEQFLKGDDWRNRVLSFVDNNCALYANDTGDISAFTHGQYDIWHEFKDLVDSCIGSVLSDLGGSEESFARACEDRCAGGNGIPPAPGGAPCHGSRRPDSKRRSCPGPPCIMAIQQQQF